MEYVGIFADLRFGAQKRIKVKDHEEWTARSSLATGDVALGMDSSAWKSKRAGVHWVHSSQREWPFLPIKVRVK